MRDSDWQLARERNKKAYTYESKEDRGHRLGGTFIVSGVFVPVIDKETGKHTGMTKYHPPHPYNQGKNSTKRLTRKIEKERRLRKMNARQQTASIGAQLASERCKLKLENRLLRKEKLFLLKFKRTRGEPVQEGASEGGAV